MKLSYLTSVSIVLVVSAGALILWGGPLPSQSVDSKQQSVIKGFKNNVSTIIEKIPPFTTAPSNNDVSLSYIRQDTDYNNASYEASVEFFSKYQQEKMQCYTMQPGPNKRDYRVTDQQCLYNLSNKVGNFVNEKCDKTEEVSLYNMTCIAMKKELYRYKENG